MIERAEYVEPWIEVVALADGKDVVCSSYELPFVPMNVDITNGVVEW